MGGRAWAVAAVGVAALWSPEALADSFIAGRLVNALTLEPWPGATVSNEDGSISVRVSPQGHFRIVLPEGRHNLQINPEGAEPFSMVRQLASEAPRPVIYHVLPGGLPTQIDNTRILFGVPYTHPPPTRPTLPGVQDGFAAAPPIQLYALPATMPATIRVGRRFATTCSGNPVQEVQEIPFEDYVKGVVPAEIGVFSGVAGGNAAAAESFKTFAVAARSYALWFYLKNPQAQYHIDDTACNQRYEDARKAAIDAAVDATAGLILAEKADPSNIDKYEYAASCGRHGSRPAYTQSIVADTTGENACVGTWCGHNTCAAHEDNPQVAGSDKCLVRGICQWGSVERSMRGDGFMAILDHYQPNLAVITIGGGPAPDGGVAPPDAGVAKPDAGVVPATAELAGFIRENDVMTGKAIPGAAVSLDNGTATTANNSGYYVFANVPLGDIIVTATAPGYLPGTTIKSLQPGVKNWASIALTPVPAVTDAGVPVPDAGLPIGDAGQPEPPQDAGVAPPDAGVLAPQDAGPADAGVPHSDAGIGPLPVPDAGAPPPADAGGPVTPDVPDAGGPCPDCPPPVDAGGALGGPDAGGFVPPASDAPAGESSDGHDDDGDDDGDDESGANPDDDSLSGEAPTAVEGAASERPSPGFDAGASGCACAAGRSNAPVPLPWGALAVLLVLARARRPRWRWTPARTHMAFAALVCGVAACGGGTVSSPTPGGEASNGGQPGEKVVFNDELPAGQPDAGLACDIGSFSCQGDVVMVCQAGGVKAPSIKCRANERCVDGTCVPETELPCDLDVDCVAHGLSGQKCVSGVCRPKGPAEGGEADDGGEGQEGTGGEIEGHEGQEGAEGTAAEGVEGPDAGVDADGGTDGGGDAGVVCVPTGDETCDGTDNDCDGEIDESLTQACERGCGPGEEICVSGAWVECSAPTGCSCMPGTSKTVSCGKCGERVLSCQADGEYDDPPCNDPVNACGGCAGLATEPGGACGDCGAWVCNGEDAVKCDDPGKRTCTDYGTCAPTVVCGACPAKPAETCDGKDNDCDATTVEEGLALNCAPGFVCKGATCCADECATQGERMCGSGTAYRECGQFDGDGCLDWGPDIACGDIEVCEGGQCQCVPQCAGKVCGPDACGGQCGTCGSGQSCLSGQCVQCNANDHKACLNGDAWWYDSCGNATAVAESCNPAFGCANGACLCVPSCTGKNCGDDGCGGSCGTCSPPQSCGGGGQSGVCGCTDDGSACSGKECGQVVNNCGQTVTCGQCAFPAACNGFDCQCPTCTYGAVCKDNLDCNPNYLTCSGGKCACKSGWFPHASNGHCYKIVAGSATWAAADLACQDTAIGATGAHLITVTNSSENSFMMSLNAGADWWLGASDTVVENDFRWVTGETWSYTYWLSGQPNNGGEGGNEDCLASKPTGWYDRACSQGIPYICEVP